MYVVNKKNPSYTAF